LIEQAAILCGGLGSRLGALTVHTPKPLLRVAGRPFLDLLLSRFGRGGVRRILLLAGFAANEISHYAASTSIKDRWGLSIEVSVEPNPAGTGGALWHAREFVDETFFLLNGDSWFDIELSVLAAALLAEPAAAAVIAVRRLKDAARYGAVEIAGGADDRNRRPHRIRGFAERPAKPGPGLVSGGVYACRRRLLDTVSPICSLEKEAFPALAVAGSLLALPFEGYFIDIGVPEALAQAERDLAAVWTGFA
jgi:NDP-sugar pyrophosphorylase family protein